MIRSRKIAAAALAATGLALAIAPAQAGTAKKTVEVGDYYFSPAKLTVRKNTLVVWRWPESGGDAPYLYVVSVEINDLEQLSRDMESEQVQRLLSELGRYADVTQLMTERFV